MINFDCEEISKKTIMFICRENACRSQMAEVFGKKLRPKTEIISAGLNAVDEINPNAIKVMEEIGYSMKDQYPKLLTADMVNKLDLESSLVVTMGCIDQCPLTPRKITFDWKLEDPAGKDIEFFRKTRDEIKKRIEALKKEYCIESK